MTTVLIIGKGNVATHLTKILLQVKTIKVVQISSRNLENIPFADVSIIAVSDDAIAQVSKKITNPFVVHTSGSVSLNALQNNSEKGVFYMLQSFTKEKEINFDEIPFCLEATSDENFNLLKIIAQSIGKKIYNINSEQRKTLHVAAVFVNNFSNHLYKIASDICTKNNVPFEILYPLIKETYQKIESLSPEKAQTGPAIRNDENTIKKHLSLLNSHQKKIYTILTKSIQNGH